MTLFYVFRWRGQAGWRLDCWDEDNPIGHPTRAEAEARVSQLVAAHRQRSNKPLWALPQIIAGQGAAAPLWKPRKKTQLRCDEPASTNGHSYATTPAGPIQRTRTATGAERRGRL